MLDIDSNGIVKLSRGDIFEAPLFINQGDLDAPIRYKIQEHPNTKVYFSLMSPNQPFEFGHVRKVYDSTSKVNDEGDIEIRLDPIDTINLLPGKYYYAIKMVLDGDINNVNTIIEKTEFTLL